MAMTALRVLIRGLRHRAASTLAVFVVALVGSSAAAVGPAYYAAARTSIVRDTVAAAPPSTRGVEVSAQTTLPALPLLDSTTTPVFDRLVPADVRRRALEPLVESIQGTVVLPGGADSAAPLVWRTDLCAHVRLSAGQCSDAPGAVVVSASTASLARLRVGSRFSSDAWGPLTVTGVYDVPDASGSYWFGKGSTYFPYESGVGDTGDSGSDALFTSASTVAGGQNQPQGTVSIDRLLRSDTVRPVDLQRLVAGVVELQQRFEGTSGDLQVVSGLPVLQQDITASWKALRISILLVTLQLLVLVWLVLFTVVGDAIAARGPEIALAKLRGRRGTGLLGFALGEPLVLLALALPAGVGVAALLGRGLDSVLLRPDTPATVPWTAWLAALTATLGGLVAIAVAGRRTLRRGVLDQWQHASREATQRGWLVDGIVLTAAVAAIVELVVGGQVTSSHPRTLGLLVPGLLGLAVAVVASRALPWLARRSFAATRRRGGLGAFLAVRQIARRTAGARTTIVLAAAFALATFAVAAWSTGQSNRRLVADVQVGAPHVLTVSPGTTADQGTTGDLGAAVDRLDPGGTRAAVVDNYFSATATTGTLLAVDPQRFAHVAAWRGGFATQSLATLMRRLAPPEAAPVRITGDMLRVRLTVDGLEPQGLVLGATLGSPGSSAAVNAELGALPRSNGSVTLTAAIGGCPCTLRSLDLSSATTGTTGVQVNGALTLDGIDVHGSHGWTALPGLQDTRRWRQLTGSDVDAVQSLSEQDGGLTWPVSFSAVSSASLAVADTPVALPAVVSTTVPTGPVGSVVPVLGLDGNNVQIRSVARTTAVPGAPSGGVIVEPHVRRTGGGLGPRRHRGAAGVGYRGRRAVRRGRAARPALPGHRRAVRG